MKICFFNDIECLGGGEIWALRACRILETLGHGVAIASPRGSALRAECQGSGLDHVAYTRDSQGMLDEEFGSFLDQRQFDLIYCTVMGNFCEVRALERIANRINAERRNKMAIVLKTGLPPIGKLAPDHYGCGAGPAVRRLHVVAPSLELAFVKWEPAFDSGFIHVFREGVDLDRFKRNARRAIPGGHTVVTCLARLADGMKGQSVLLRSIPRLLELHPRTVFVLAGDGDDRSILEELAEDLNIASAVRFTGQVDDVRALLNTTDILCHPSLHDGLPNAIVEAMAMCVPVVASRVGAIPELIADGESGLLVRPNDVRELTSALDCLLRNDHGRRERMGCEGRVRVARDWDLHKNIVALSERLDQEVREFVEEPDRRTAPACPLVPAGVLFVLNSIRTGGEETELAILGRYLDRKRFTMSVLSLTEGAEAAPALAKIKAWGISVDTTCHAIPGYSDKVEYLLTKIRQEGIRVVVACHNAQLVYEAFAHLSPRECRLIEHGGVPDDVTWISKDRTERYVGVSTAITAAAAELMKRRQDAVFIPSMVDTEEYDGEEFAAARAWTKKWLRDTCLPAHGVPMDACVVLFVGRFDPRKRVEDFIRAATELRWHPAPAFFLIIGGGDALHPDYELRLRREASALVEANKLEFIETRSDIAGLLSASDILVLPSVGEGMAHVISEAGAAGLAVIACDDGAAREQLDGGNCGIIVTPGAVAELADGLRTLIDNRELRKSLGARLKERVNARYSARVVIEQWHSVLEDAVRVD